MVKELYQWRKGDNLEKIAKANGLKNGAVIWSDPDNKVIAKMRGAPEKLMPGDKLWIENLAEKTKILEKIIANLEKMKDETQKELDRCENAIKQTRKLTSNLVAEIEEHRKKFRQDRNIADIIILSKGLVKGLVKTGTAGFQISSDAEKAALATQKQAVEGIKEIYDAPAEFAVPKFAEALKKNHSKVVLVAVKTVELLDNWTSPFWWGNAIDRTLNGAPLSDTLLTSLDDDLERQQKEVVVIGAEAIASYEISRTHALERLATISGELKIKTAALKAAKH